MFVKHTKWAILWALLILILCAIPGSDLPRISLLEGINFDKVVHASLFFILVLLTARGFKLQNTFMFIQRNYKGFAFIECVIYGGLLEIMQEAFFSQRTADILDFAANTLGCLLGILFYDIIERRWLKNFIC